MRGDTRNKEKCQGGSFSSKCVSPITTSWVCDSVLSTTEALHPCHLSNLTVVQILESFPCLNFEMECFIIWFHPHGSGKFLQMDTDNSFFSPLWYIPW